MSDSRIACCPRHDHAVDGCVETGPRDPGGARRTVATCAGVRLVVEHSQTLGARDGGRQPVCKICRVRIWHQRVDAEIDGARLADISKSVERTATDEGPAADFAADQSTSLSVAVRAGDRRDGHP
jgi:hypothetical protein